MSFRKYSDISLENVNSGLKFILFYIVDHHFFAGALLLRFHFNMPLLSIDRATRSFFYTTLVYIIFIYGLKNGANRPR